ncbi:MAG: response regulator [Anaerotruncus sp.]|nr:response regulator [Anaerotruncus sp.]
MVSLSPLETAGRALPLAATRPIPERACRNRSVPGSSPPSPRPFLTLTRGGTGLGLAIMAGTSSELMGAAQGYAPGENGGSVFWSRDPLEPGSHGQPPRVPPLLNPPPALLCVDDHPRARGLPGPRPGHLRHIRRGGILREEALSGPGDGPRRDGQPFDLRLIDQEMPGMDGRRLAGEIKSTRSWIPSAWS